MDRNLPGIFLYYKFVQRYLILKSKGDVTL